MSMKRINGQKLKKYLLGAIQIYSRTELSVCTGNATLFLLMSIVPLLMLAVAVINLIPGFSADDLTEILNLCLPDLPEIRALVQSTIRNLNNQSGGVVISISAVMTLYSASKGVSAIQYGLAKINENIVSTLWAKLISLIYTLVFVLLIPAFLIFQVLHNMILELMSALTDMLSLPDLFQQLDAFMRYSGIISAALMVCVIMLTYSYLSGTKERFRSQLPGSILASVLWITFSAAFSYFIPMFWKSSSFYGSLASVFLIAMWLRYIMIFLFFGAALNKSIQNVTRNV